MKDRFRFYIYFTLLYAALIFSLSSSSKMGQTLSIIRFFEPFPRSLESSGLVFLSFPLLYSDKIFHIALYAGFGFLLYLLLNNSPYKSLRNHVHIFAVIIGAFYGASDEFHQFFVPGRTANIWDILADIIGLTLTQTIIFIKHKLYFKI